MVDFDLCFTSQDGFLSPDSLLIKTNTKILPVFHDDLLKFKITFCHIFFAKSQFYWILILFLSYFFFILFLFLKKEVTKSLEMPKSK